MSIFFSPDLYLLLRTTNLEALIVLELSPFAQTKQTIAHAQTQNHFNEPENTRQHWSGFNYN
jgi:hypothetical protein